MEYFFFLSRRWISSASSLRRVQQREAAEEFLARLSETGYKPEKPSAFRRFISEIRLWLRERGFFVFHLSDDDIASIISKSVRAGLAKKKGTSKFPLGVGDQTARFAVGEEGTDEYGGVRSGADNLGLAAELENEQDLDILTEIKKLSEKGGTEPNSQYHTDSINKLH